MKITPTGLRALFFLVTVLIFLISCNNNRNCVPSPDVSGINIDLQVERIDEQLFKIKSEAELAQLIDKNPVFAEVFLSRSQYPHDSILIARFFQLLHDPSIDTLWQETKQVFGILRKSKISLLKPSGGSGTSFRILPPRQ
jgi:hypothetical protein